MDILSDVSFYGDLDIKQNLLFKTNGIKLGSCFSPYHNFLAFEEIDPKNNNNLRFYISPSQTTISYFCNKRITYGSLSISTGGASLTKRLADYTTLDAFPVYVNISVPSGCNEFEITRYVLQGDYNYTLYPRVFVYKNNKKVEMDIELQKTGGTEIVIGKIENGSTESENYVFILDGISG